MVAPTKQSQKAHLKIFLFNQMPQNLSFKIGISSVDSSPLVIVALNFIVLLVADLGFSHVELMPVMQHPFGGSWGYHVTSYFAPDSRFGDPDGFRRLVDAFHQRGIGVLLDWVPGHFATDEWALARFDGTPLYEDPNPQRGWHKEWGSHIFNFGRREVRNFLYANALYWLEEFHADGLRVDGVASMLYLDYARTEGEWTPNIHGGNENLEAVQFLQEMNATVYKRVPGATTIAEESTSWPGVTAADLGATVSASASSGTWAGCTTRLDYLKREPVHRAWHHNDLTFGLTYAFTENFVLPLSHDEVVHGKGSLLRKMPGDRWQQLANLRAYLAFMWAHPGKQLLFMGCEIGQESEWAESRELDWWLLDHPEHLGVHRLVKDLNAAYAASPAIWSREDEASSFEWIDANDAGRNVVLVHPPRAGGLDGRRPGVRDQLRGGPAHRLPARPALGRRVARGAQHRRRHLHRLRRRQPRLRHRPRGSARRPARARDARRAAAGDGLVGPLRASSSPAARSSAKGGAAMRPVMAPARAATRVGLASEPPEQPTLTDGEVTLRPWRDEDVPEAVAGARRGDRPLVRLAGRRGHARAHAAGDPRLAGGLRRRAGRWSGSRSRTASGLAGSVDVRRRDPGVGELSWALFRGRRGRGLATRAVRLLADYALTETGQGGLGYSRVEAKVEPGNEASLRVATRAGLRREGERRVEPGTGDRAETTSYVVLARLASDPPLTEPGGVPGAPQLLPPPQAGDQPAAGPRPRRAGC